MLPREADNIVAAGRSVDADVQALSAIRVMGPCIAMGAAAAHALDLSGSKIDYLPDAGIRGNSHMMMLDRNNKQIADRIMGWIARMQDAKCRMQNVKC